MTFEYFLPRNGIIKNIHLNLIDKKENKTYTFRTYLQISENDWDKEKQRPKNIYLKKYKKLNVKLDLLKKELAEHIREKRLEKKQLHKRTLAREIKVVFNSQISNLPENSFLYYMKWYIDIKKELICYSTYKRYMVFFHLLERFEGYICKKLYMQRLRLYLSAQNLFTIKSNKFTGLDPENANFGYPIPVNVTFGVNVSF